VTEHRYRLPGKADASSTPPEAIRLPHVSAEAESRHTAMSVPDRRLGERSAARAASRAGRAKRGGPLALRLLRETAVVVVIALVLSLLIKTFVAQSFWIPSESMENTLVPGDRVVVSKFTPGPFALKRGDVVVFHDPDHWLNEPNVTHSGASGVVTSLLQFVGLYPSGDNDLIKRVIGLPGDHVKCCNTRGQLTVNGVGLTEPYIYPGGGTDQKTFSVTVPSGRVWVMGDNRGDSSDSRFHDDGTGRTGSVPESDIIGRADMIVWPVDRMGWLSNYSSTFDKVPKP